MLEYKSKCAYIYVTSTFFILREKVNGGVSSLLASIHSEMLKVINDFTKNRYKNDTNHVFIKQSIHTQ